MSVSYTHHTEYPILTVGMAPGGTMAVATRSERYLAEITVYDLSLIHICGLDLADQALDPAFELAAELGAGHQGGQVQQIDLPVRQAAGHLALGLSLIHI